MSYILRLLPAAEKSFAQLQRKYRVKHAKVVSCLRKLANDPKYPGLNSHKYASLRGPNGEDVWESYVENNTPAAWRVFWIYGPDESDAEDSPLPTIKIISIIAITPIPDPART